MGERAQHVFEQQAGATARSIEAIRKILDPSSMLPPSLAPTGNSRGPA
jgi:hypothetical protein